MRAKKWAADQKLEVVLVPRDPVRTTSGVGS